MLYGAVIGDIAGSIYEFNPIRTKPARALLNRDTYYTDDTVMTLAIADAILRGKGYAKTMKDWARKDNKPERSYGGRFLQWVESDSYEPYNSFGNGSAMRVSPVGWAAKNHREVLEMARATAAVTHDHPEGIKGAQAVAIAIFMARSGDTKDQIKNYIERWFGYNLSRTCEEIRKTYYFDETCQGSVPEAIVAFLESTDFVDAVRLAISLGGDADTQAAIAGAIAEAYYGVPEALIRRVRWKLNRKQLAVIDEFNRRYGHGRQH